VDAEWFASIYGDFEVIKRNSVVSDERDRDGGWSWTPFGRVVTVKNGLVFVVFGFSYGSDWIPVDKLKVHDYKGRWDDRKKKSYFGRPIEDEGCDCEHMYSVWLAMPTLRKLKQSTARRNPGVWEQKTYQEYYG
jgi:hypothetical protein